METKLSHNVENLQRMQTKLDNLFERQNAEKENAKLIQKYETEKESRKLV